MQKYLIYIKINGDFVEIKTDEVASVTKNIQPYLVDLPTLTNFLMIAGRTPGSAFDKEWQTGEFICIERKYLI